MKKTLISILIILSGFVSVFAKPKTVTVSCSKYFFESDDHFKKDFISDATKVVERMKTKSYVGYTYEIKPVKIGPISDEMYYTTLIFDCLIPALPFNLFSNLVFLIPECTSTVEFTFYQEEDLNGELFEKMRDLDRYGLLTEEAKSYYTAYFFVKALID